MLFETFTRAQAKSLPAQISVGVYPAWKAIGALVDDMGLARDPKLAVELRPLAPLVPGPQQMTLMVS